MRLQNKRVGIFVVEDIPDFCRELVTAISNP
jgi:hypothetical protein